MTDTIKTLSFVFAGLFLVALAWALSPRQTVQAVSTEDMTGKLFEDFAKDDRPDLRRLKIVRYDGEIGELNDFEVQLVNDVWVIPSHNNYPADASTQLADTSVTIANTERVGIATDDPAEHAIYGVVEPTEDQLRENDLGLGTLVTIEGEGGKKLVNVVIGRPDPDAVSKKEETAGESSSSEITNENETAEERAARAESENWPIYARRVGQDRVYEVKLDISKLTPRFEDWIESDLLNLDSNDISSVTFDDYSTDVKNQASPLQQRSLVRLSRENNTWEIQDLLVMRRGKMQESNLALDEELDDQKLNDMRVALDQLEIVNVSRKPRTLAKSLRQGRIELDQEAGMALARAGFYLLRDANERFDLYSENGEIRFQTNDGVLYQLRFGNVQDASQKDANGELDLRRYLFVTANANPDAVPEPEYAPLPKAPATPDGGDADAAEIEAQRRTIQEANDKLKTEWQEKVKDLNAKVRDLNDRFADWFFVVSEETYQNIHLGRNDIITDAANADETGFGVDAFRKLESGGIDPPEEKPAPQPRGGFPGGPGGFPGGFSPR